MKKTVKKPSPKTVKSVSKSGARGKKPSKGGASSKAKAVSVTPQQMDAALEMLMALGKKQGFVTIEQMKKNLSADMQSADKVEELIAKLNEKGIGVTSEAIGEQGKSTIDVLQDVDAKKTKDSELEEDGIEEPERVRIDDPVRTYLRQMGQIALLTREQEIALAKKIEDCEEELKKVV